MKNLIFAILIGFISSCAIGPLASHETARTVGKGKVEGVGAYGHMGYVFKGNVGLSENLDVGIQLESLSLGARAKYMFTNPSDSLAIAGALGVGSSFGGDHYYGDFMMSHLRGIFEPYGTVRIVSVKTDPSRVRDADTGDILFNIPSATFQYGQFILGSRFWFGQDQRAFGSIEASSLFGLTSGLTFGNNLLISAGVGVRFKALPFKAIYHLT